jgi:hypothetical protein
MLLLHNRSIFAHKFVGWDYFSERFLLAVYLCFSCGLVIIKTWCACPRFPAHTSGI